jgi:hypothetical protein
MQEKYLDLTGEIVEWGMYSYDRPSILFWNGVANGLHESGWTEEQIKSFLMSKFSRKELDGKAGRDIESLGQQFGNLWSAYLNDVKGF